MQEKSENKNISTEKNITRTEKKARKKETKAQALAWLNNHSKTREPNLISEPINNTESVVTENIKWPIHEDIDLRDECRIS